MRIVVQCLSGPRLAVLRHRSRLRVSALAGAIAIAVSACGQSANPAEEFGKDRTHVGATPVGYFDPVLLPACWDGKVIDPKKYKDHVGSPAYRRRCPRNFTMPEITALMLWNTDGSKSCYWHGKRIGCAELMQREPKMREGYPVNKTAFMRELRG